MRNFLCCLLTLIALGYSNEALSQQTNPNNIGSVKGVLRDTTHNYFLKSSTVSLFKGDSTLVSYQLSNTYGEFSFRNLPLNAKMYIEVSHIGYELLRKSFTITDAKVPLDLKILIIATKDITLKEVQVKIPPITMNGDTLEFNAAAFKLDSNAVVEDLLRKIPNITLWGDGQITVNGREVKSLLVNGKPFFGGDFKTATQNISKNALEKVQVYNTVQDRTKPLDSTLEVNLKLKKGKDVGYFGKVGGGAGSRERYESDLSINAFSPKIQAAIIGASNNVNKIATSMKSITANSTFKGIGTNIDYQPDFRQTGINKTYTGGLNFTYNFIPKPDYNNRKSLTSNYFAQKKFFGNITDNETVTTLNTADKVFENYVNEAKSEYENQNFDANYEYAKKSHQFSIKQNFSINKGQTNNTVNRSAFDNQNKLTSTNNSLNKGDTDSKRFAFSGRYNFRPQYKYDSNRRFGGVNVTYNLNINDNNSQRNNITTFRSVLDPLQNKDFNRQYITQSRLFNQQINAEFPELKSLIFGNATFLGNFSLTLVNNFNQSVDQSHNKVADLNTATNTFQPNANLTNAIHTNVIDDSFGFTISRGYQRNLSNRYSKTLSFSLSAKQRLINQDNSSDRAFQNINRSYSNFVPSASINYNENQFGEFYRFVNVSYETNIRVPSIQQLAPLIDDANVYNIQNGNINLKEEIDRTINLMASYNSQKTKNNFGVTVNFGYTFNNNNIVDSLFIDKQNRRSNFLTNANGAKSYSGNVDFRKSFKLKTSELQLTLSSNASRNRTPGYLNTVFLFSTTTNSKSGLNLNFTYKDKWAVDAGQSFVYYKSKQEAFNTEYDGKTWASILSANYNITKKIALNTNVSFNSNKAGNNEYINFNIWNASAIFRFLKGNNAEFKFSALDILHQNNNVMNSASLNSFTTGTQTVLQNYFITTFSYYPRQFGKKTTAK